MTQQGHETRTVEDWITRINQRELAALAAIVQRVQSLVGDEDSSAAQLSEVLRLDPSLSSKILRIANSPTYLVSPDPVTTLTRATTLIGFDAIANICITNRLLETLLARKELSRSVVERVLDRTAASLHAAVQARVMISNASSREREEAFLGALLEQIGESAFWSLGGAEIDALDTALATTPQNTREALIRRTVGGSFRQLSRGLIKAWHLGPGTALHEKITPARASRAQVILLANELADCVACEGWESPLLDDLYARIAALTNIETGAAAMRVRACGREAEGIARCYGASMLAQRMSHKPAGAKSRRTSAHGDSSVRLGVLQELGAMQPGTADINTVMQTAIDGIYRGIGMDRVIAALLSDDRKTLSARFWLGDGCEQWGPTFRFSVTRRDDILHQCVANNRSFRHDASAAQAPAGLMPAELLDFCQSGDLLLAPVLVGTRCIGVLYADRTLSGAAISQEDFDAFAELAHQLALSIELVGKPAS